MTWIAQALLWSKADGGTTPMAIVYDSEYAAKLTQAEMQPKSNALLATMCNKLYQEEVSRRPIAFIWVRGHSANKGNDRADLLVQWGKEQGPYSRIPRAEISVFRAVGTIWAGWAGSGPNRDQVGTRQGPVGTDGFGA